MGNNTSIEAESSRNFGAKFKSKKAKRIKGHDSNEDLDIYSRIEVDVHIGDLTEIHGQRKNKTKEKVQKSKGEKKEKKSKSKSKSKGKDKKSKSQKKDKEPSNRVKRIEDYFQWETITEEQKEMYYEFIGTAKNTWEDNGFNDEEVRKAVLDKIALMRFWIARDFDPKKTFDMWIKWVEWRFDYQPHKIRRSEIKDSTLNKCFYMCGQNKRGCPLIVISPGATSEVYDIHSMFKLAAYTMEKACKIWDRNGTTQMCVLFDRKNMHNSTEKKWLPLYKELSTLIQDYYPERLHQAYVLHMNWFARLIYQLCKPFIAKKDKK